MAARERFEGESLAAPELIDLEVASGLRGLVRSGQVSTDFARRKLAEMAMFPLERFPHQPFLPRIWELCHDLSVYGATCAALAEVLGVSLLTADREIATTPGLACEVELLAVESG